MIGRGSEVLTSHRHELHHRARKHRQRDAGLNPDPTRHHIRRPIRPPRLIRRDVARRQPRRTGRQRLSRRRAIERGPPHRPSDQHQRQRQHQQSDQHNRPNPTELSDYHAHMPLPLRPVTTSDEVNHRSPAPRTKYPTSPPPTVHVPHTQRPGGLLSRAP